MKFTRTGIILNSENYPECRDFYGSILELPLLETIRHDDEEITVFALGDTYLMVEPGGTASPGTKPPERCPTKFRFNVDDVEAACAQLRAKGVTVRLRRHEWGTTAEFADPDGNRCALRSEHDFNG
ncbi:glyoxalase [Roseovarius spongiae]|uniref:Glyoxalase n=1 Tax=Roseovarius spongiae TaxID=2320272 RepID=A0A3A8B8U5_9RHOB|nr:VOC family protein [Roseovarius spongiae]RKF14138.1 glyoxalase [Roseovarius spongiae]